jgi:hypothetical protein
MNEQTLEKRFVLELEKQKQVLNLKRNEKIIFKNPNPQKDTNKRTFQSHKTSSDLKMRISFLPSSTTQQIIRG